MGKEVLQVIRPSRESTTGWTPEPGSRSRRNQSSYKLNEHGAALNVFWSRSSGMGAGYGAKASGQRWQVKANHEHQRRKNVL
jgi:hypothetical protein